MAKKTVKATELTAEKMTKKKAGEWYQEHLAQRDAGSFMALSDETLALLTRDQQLDYFRTNAAHLSGQITGLSNVIMEHFADEIGTEVEGTLTGTEGACDMAATLLKTLPAHRDNSLKVASLNEYLQTRGDVKPGSNVTEEVVRLLTKLPDNETASTMTAAEALFGFAGWLTSREEAVTFSAHHWASPAACMVAEFLKANNCSDSVANDWHERLVHPTWVITDDFPDHQPQAVPSLTQAVCFLFSIIDDIDTLGDVCKDNLAAYRDQVETQVRRRWETTIETDGYRIGLKTAGSPRQFVEGTDYTMDALPLVAAQAVAPETVSASDPESDTTTLSDEAFDTLEEAVSNPQEPTQAMKDLMGDSDDPVITSSVGETIL